MKKTIKLIEEIPEDLIRAAKIDGLPDRAINGKIKIGAFADGKLIGFASAILLEDSLMGTAVFVTKQYRRQGFATKLSYRLLGEAKKRGLKGVEFKSPTRGSRRIFKKEGKNPRTPKIFEKFEMGRYDSKTKSFLARFRRK